MFETVMGSLGDASRLWLAWHNGVTVAGLITLIHGQHAASWGGWSDPALAGPVRANNLLQRLAIEDACQAGCQSYNMSESGGILSLEHFKQTMGATPQFTLECSFERLPLGRLHTMKDRAQAQVGRLVGYRSRLGRRHVAPELMQ